RHGIGHPEPLVGGNNEIYSRHISAHDRIIYRIHDEEIFVIIIELEGHYSDK
ncbi:MAG: type II toxin-antitoxin system YoeB family toxin, partial [Duncaniella sp.]|nr:type II toxin-antitoxin system YoeB family toxin [Duncaniella sp.]